MTTTKLNRCPACGQGVSPLAKACTACGHPLLKSIKPLVGTLIIAIGVLLIMAGAVYYFAPHANYWHRMLAEWLLIAGFASAVVGVGVRL